MEKIPSVFKRNLRKGGEQFFYEDEVIPSGYVYPEVNPDCQWVLDGEGTAFAKWDGTPVLFQNGKFYKRYDVKPGRKEPLNGFPAQAEPDAITAHWPWWVPISKTDPADQWFREALVNEMYWGENYEQGQSTIFSVKVDRPTTMELIGPKIRANPHGWSYHSLRIHRSYLLLWDVSGGDFYSLREKIRYLHKFEGVVWWHPDGRKAKLKRSDFGFRWPV